MLLIECHVDTRHKPYQLCQALHMHLTFGMVLDIRMVEQLRPTQPTAGILDKETLEKVSENRRKVIGPADGIVHYHVDETV